MSTLSCLQSPIYTQISHWPFPHSQFILYFFLLIPSFSEWQKNRLMQNLKKTPLWTLNFGRNKRLTNAATSCRCPFTPSCSHCFDLIWKKVRSLVKKEYTAQVSFMHCYHLWCRKPEYWPSRLWRKWHMLQ